MGFAALGAFGARLCREYSLWFSTNEVQGARNERKDCIYYMFSNYYSSWVLRLGAMEKF